MIKIVIIGNSAAGFSCCNSLLKIKPDIELTVISQESFPAYKANLLIGYLAGNVNEEGLFLCKEDFYEMNKIRFLKDSKAVGINIRKKLVFLKDNNKINYDYLVIATGQKISIPDIPGNTKDGVFGVYSLEDINKIKDRLLITDTVCIVAEPVLSLRLAEVFAKKDKFVKVVSAPKPESFILTENIEWIDSFHVSEIIGEGAQLKALKLNNGKAIGTPLILFAGNYAPCTEFLKDTNIKVHEGYIVVDSAGRTSVENIFACGSVCIDKSLAVKEKSWEEAENDGISAATNLIFFLTQPLKSV
ncbi:MAG: FAD-dependent oxidoreductase [Candidatus Omnitrophota bacterium]